MQAENYKAAIFREAGKVDVVQKTLPECGDDEAILRNLITGVCGSDVAAYHHGGDDNMIWRDHEFGHETISEVVEVGKSVKGLAVGDRVFPNLGNVYRDKQRMATVGGFSEYIHVRQCEVGYSVLRVDSSLPLKTAVLLEPFVVGTRCVRELAPKPGQTAVVFGAGIIGMSAAVMLKWYGCEKVMVVDVSDYRLEHARNLGLLTCNPAKEDLRDVVFAEFGSQQRFGGEASAVDLFIDAIGKPIAIENFSKLACRGASLGVVGVHHEPVSLDLLTLCYSNWRIHGCGDMPIEKAFDEIHELMHSGKFDLSPLVSHEYRVDDISTALEMGAKADQAQKVCIAYA